MANSDYTIRVRVQGTADVDAIKKALEGLGASVQRTQGRTSAADQAARDYLDTQKKGVIGTANATKSFSKLAETMGSGSSGIVSAYATLAANIFAVTAAFSALRNASQVEQVFRGLEASGARTGLSLTNAAKGLRDVTGAAISAEQSMRATAQIMSAGFSTKQVEQLGKAARDASFALGRNMTDSLDRISKGVVKLEPELLDELGIMTKLTESNARYAQQLGKSESQLTNFERRTGFLNAVLAEAELKFGGLAGEAGDSTAYDRLAASFTDLSNTILNAINVVFKPLASVLADSQMLLAGVGIAFASTIKNQLLPGLANSSAAAAAAAMAARADAAAQLTQVKVQHQLAKARHEANLQAAASFDYLQGSGPKAYKAVRDEMLKTIGTTEELTSVQNKGINSLNASIRMNEQVLSQHKSFQGDSDAAKANRAAKEAQIALLKQERDAMINLQNLRLNSANEELRLNTQVNEAHRAAAAARQTAAAKTSAANAIAAASALDPIQSYKQLQLGVNQYSRAVAMSSNGVVTAFGKIKIAAFAASTGIRAIGSAMLAAMPYIALITMAWGALDAVLEKMKTQAVKDLEEATERYNDVVAKSLRYAQEMERARNSETSAALRAASALTIQSNAVREIAESYEELVKARAKVNNESAWTNLRAAITGDDANADKVATFWETLGKRSINSYHLGIRKNSKVLDILDSAGLHMGLMKDETKEAARALAGLDEAAPQDLDKWVVKNYGSWKALNAAVAANPKLLESIAQAASKSLNNALGDTAERIKDLQESFKQLETDLSSFYRSAAISTPFDAVVKSISNANNAIISMSNAFEGGSDEWKALLTGLDSKTMGSLSAELQKSVTAFKEADAVAKSSKESLTGAQKALLATQSQLADRVAAELAAVEEKFIVAQELTRQYAAQVTLLQAQISANTAIYKGGAAGMKAKIKDEERVRDIQKAQLQAQKSILESSVQLAEQKLQMLETDLATNKAALERLDIAGREYIQAQKQQLIQKGITEDVLNQMEAARASGNLTGRYVGRAVDEETVKLVDGYLKSVLHVKDTQDSIVKQTSEIRAIEQQTRDTKASIKALATQIAAIDAQSLTDAEKKIEYMKAEYQLRQGTVSVLRANQAALEETNSLYEEASAITRGVSDSLDYQLSQIQRQADLQKKQRKREFDDKMEGLKLSLKEAKAAKDRAGSNADYLEAVESSVIAAQEAITAEEQAYEISIQKIDAQAKLNTLQKTYFETQKEGLSWQQDALSMIEKQIDSQRTLAEATADTFELRQKLDARRKGYEVTQAGEDAAAIRAATVAFQLAVQESSVKKALIDLEYALLDAQREQLLDEMRARKSVLDAGNPSDRVRLDQVTSVIDRLERVDMSQAAETAKRAIDVGVENARIQLQEALEPRKIVGAFSQMVGAVKDVQDRSTAEAQGKAILATAKATETAGIVQAESAETRKSLKDHVADPMIESNNKLISAIEAWIEAVNASVAKMETIQGSSAAITASSSNRVAYAMEYFQKNGGFTKTQAAALVGNLQQEARGLDPNARNPVSGAYGIAQWLSKDRVAEFQKVFGKALKDSTFEEQLKFVIHELNNAEKAAGRALKATNTLEEATLVVRKKYERPGEAEAHDAKRLKYAREAFNASPAYSTPPISASANSAAKAAEEPEMSEIVVTTAKVSAIDFGDTEHKAPNIDWSDEANKLVTNIPPLPEAPKSLRENLDIFKELTSSTIENLKELGPEGEVVVAVVGGMETILSKGQTALETLSKTSSSTAAKISAVAEVLSSAVSMIQSATAASANAKVAAIDREIEAEKKRDGKSAESVAKLAALEKKKEAIERKQFNLNKKLMMAQAVMSTAAGVANALASGPPPGNIIMASIIGAMGAAQLAIIAGTSYQSASSSAAEVNTPSTLTIGKRGDTVDLAKQNNNVGGELGYIRGTNGFGQNSSNYSIVGSAYGGDLGRGYGNAAFAVGEKGPEILTGSSPLTVRPLNDNELGSNNVTASISIHAIDAEGVQEVLSNQKGNIISMLREAANAHGQPFMEKVNVNSLSRPNKTGNSKL